MNNNLGVFLRISYVGIFLVLTKYIGDILSTTLVFQILACFFMAYWIIRFIEKIYSKNLNLYKSWALRLLIWSICALGSPAIGFSFPRICMFILSFLLLMFTLIDSVEFAGFMEDLFLSFVTDSRILGIVILALGFLIYVLITEGWSKVSLLFNV